MMYVVAQGPNLCNHAVGYAWMAVECRVCSSFDTCLVGFVLYHPIDGPLTDLLC